jgi:hypothetical protein
LCDLAMTVCCVHLVFKKEDGNAIRSHLKHLVADATLFDCVATSTLDIHYFAWGLCCGRFLKLTGSLLGVELSRSDCVEMKVSR